MKHQAQPIPFPAPSMGGEGTLVLGKKVQREPEPRFFIQFKTESGNWMFATPKQRMYGFKTIEECETAITTAEELDKDMGLEPTEYRMKEELV